MLREASGTAKNDEVLVSSPTFQVRLAQGWKAPPDFNIMRFRSMLDETDHLVTLMESKKTRKSLIGSIQYHLPLYPRKYMLCNPHPPSYALHYATIKLVKGKFAPVYRRKPKKQHKLPLDHPPHSQINAEAHSKSCAKAIHTHDLGVSSMLELRTHPSSQSTAIFVIHRCRNQ